MSRLPYRIRGVDRVVIHGGDAAVLPSWERQGINRAMSDFKNTAQYCDLVVNNSPVYGNFRVIHPLGNKIRRLLRPLRPMEFGREVRRDGSRLPGAAIAAAIMARSAWSRLRHRTPKSAARGLKVRPIHAFDSRFDALWEQASAPYEFIASRTSEFLSWRYDPRGSHYQTLAAVEGDTLLGYCVFTVHGSRGYIADLLTLPYRGDVVRHVVERAVQDLHRQGVAAVTCWLPQAHPYYRILRRSGFIDGRDQLQEINVGGESMADEDLTFVENPRVRVHFTHGDTDVV